MASPYEGLHPEFARRVRALIEASGGRVKPGSGYRTYDEQARLYERYKAGKGNLAAPPGESNHNYGMAMDLQGDLEWANAHAHEFGLHFPVKGENWHVEATGLNRHTAGDVTVTNAQQPVSVNLAYEPNPDNPEDALGARLDSIMGILTGGVNPEEVDTPDMVEPAMQETVIAPEGQTTTVVGGEPVADPTGMGEYARRRLAELGFGEAEYRALVWLWNKESGDPKERHEVTWNPQADNPRSSAAGIAQKLQSVHGPVEDSWQEQIDWGLDYIIDRHGSPSRALAFHQSNNWY